MNDRVRFVDREDLVDKLLIREVALDEREVREAMSLFGGVEAGVDGVDGRRGDGAHFIDPLAARKVVDEQDAIVSSGGDS